MKTLLIVEDEKRLRDIVRDYLEDANYRVLEAENGVEALDIINDQHVDMILLDIMMPELNGFEVCKEVRKKGNTLIVFLSAKSEETDKLIGFELGADEYITKPFSPRVLVARIKALFKLVESRTLPNKVEIDNIYIDLDGYQVYVDGEEIALTSKEYQLLILLYENKNKVLKRDMILDTIWGYDYYGTDRVLDTNIKTLRKKMKSFSKRIKTVINVGYKLEVGNEE